MVLQSPEGLSIAQVVKFTFVASNNEAKYEAVLLRLQLAKKLSVTHLELRCDWQLVASQLRGEYEDKNGQMEQYMRIHEVYSGSSL